MYTRPPWQSDLIACFSSPNMNPFPREIRQLGLYEVMIDDLLFASLVDTSVFHFQFMQVDI
jgi:hypothetical protein